MRRRIIDCGRLKRLPTKKSRVTEPVQTGSSYLHWKLLLGWLILLLLDSLADFRFEYLYPVLMFMRSVYDSYKYQGLIFSLLFICLVVYLDLLCWTVLTGPWLFLGASSCVWLEFMRTSEQSFSYSTLSLWMFFLYIEISHRLHILPQHLLNVSRPFAAHCIGYPVVTMSFLIKHQITHIIKQRQQKRVAEENAHFFDVLQKALPPQEELKSPEDANRDKTGVTADDSIQNSDQKMEQRGKVSPKPPSGTSGGSCKPPSKGTSTNPKHKGNTLSRSDPKTVTSMKQEHSKPNDQRLVCSKQENGKSMERVVVAKQQEQSLLSGATTTGAAVQNGDIVRPSSASKLVSGKKQATVRAVPRSDLPPPVIPPEPEKDKTRVLLDSLQAELKSERHLRAESELAVSQLEMEIKKLKADLQASCLQEEETTSRVDYLLSQEKTHKLELQRLRNESDNLQNKLSKMSVNKQHDQASISLLERQLKQESDIRLRVEAELREHLNAVQNSWSAEEVKELQEKLKSRGKEIEGVKKELQAKRKICEELQRDIANCRVTIRALEEERNQLKLSLGDETRVKIELFTALSEAGRKQQSLMEECHRKRLEINALRQNLAEIMAIMPGPPTSTLPPHSQH